MDEAFSPNSALKAEATLILKYLSQGVASVSFAPDTGCCLKRNGSDQLKVSTEALQYLSRKKWLKREKNLVCLSQNAPILSSNCAEQRTTEQCQLVENGQTRLVTRVTVESPLDHLASRKDKTGAALINQEQWTAGDRLRSDFTRANMLPSIGMRWGEPIRGSANAGGSCNQTDAAIAARLRVNKALGAVGPEFSGLLLDVCCFLKGLEQIELERRWPQRSAKVMVRAGLSILARHYAPQSRPK